MGDFSCASCVFWNPERPPTEGTRAMYGECRRNSPRLKMDRVADEDHAIWPPTSAANWCGEYRPTSLSFPFATPGA